MNPARASSRHHGARAPSSQGTAMTPLAPGGLSAARGASSSEVRPSNRPSQARNDPAADRPPSSSQPSSAARVTTAPAGEGTGRSGTGTDTLAVVPQLTMGRASDAPDPSTSHWRSPAPITTGMPGRSPSSDPAPTQVPHHGVRGHHARQLAQRRAGQLPHGVAVEVVEAATQGEGRVRDDWAVMRYTMRSRGERMTSAASSRSGSFSASQANLAAPRRRRGECPCGPG